jgi:protein involved in polysaccharide export with SLBB domain
LLINDSVNIKVFQEEELLTTERIARDGTITFPFIGTVSLVGRTLQESAEILQARLREYLVHPQVTVRVVEYSKRRFTVLGQVSKPGIYELPDDSSLTLLEAIGMAGGYTRIANPSKVTLKRQGSRGEDTLYRLDAARMARDKDSQRFDVQAGDTILVGESFL